MKWSEITGVSRRSRKRRKPGTLQGFVTMELAGLEPATSWVRSKLASGKLGARRLRFPGASPSWSEAPLGADSGGYLRIASGFRHFWRLVPESKRAVRCRGGLPHSSAGRASELPGLEQAGERVRARITRRRRAVMLAEEHLALPRAKRSTTSRYVSHNARSRKDNSTDHLRAQPSPSAASYPRACVREEDSSAGNWVSERGGTSHGKSSQLKSVSGT